MPTTFKTPVRRGPGTVALAFASCCALIAGCGSNADDAATGPSSSSSTTGTPASTPAPTDSVPSATTPISTPAPTTPTSKPTPKPTARDGSNLRACRDANCQVLVRGRTTIKFSGGKLVVTRIDKFAHFTLSGSYGGGSGQLGPNCAVTFGYGGLTSRCGGTKPAPPTTDPPGLTVRVPYVGKGTAVIDMHRR